ncbi:MAG: FAD:protein FMN transferase [Bryobacter sp.]|nr:FAD:protein FMN transferase [Bryobacter sp.]
MCTLTLCAGLSPSLRAADALRYEASVDAMGGTYTIAVYGDDRFKLEAAVGEAFDEVKRLDALLSNYKPTSEWSKVNREAGRGPVVVSEELFQLLSACVNYSRQSEGTFDITVGPLMKVWGFYKGSGRLPHRAEVRGALASIGWQNIQLDPRARTVRFTKPELEIDPGGIGKGYAVDRMAAILRQFGIRTGFISAAGSTLFGMGAPPGERGWPVKIRHPRDPHRSVAEVFLKDESMSTSGTQEKFFIAGGRLYSHIMDPRTGFPAEGMVSVSVIAPRAIDSEAWTKPVFIQGRRWAEKNKPKSLRVLTCEDGWETPCAWLQ